MDLTSNNLRRSGLILAVIVLLAGLPLWQSHVGADRQRFHHRNLMSFHNASGGCY